MCWKCPLPLDASGKVAFRDLCPSCGRELHACRNCVFFLIGANHDCREDSAEPVADKERANLCDYFRPKAGLSASGPSGGGSERARGEFDRLFGGS